jgi:hypothetical protein
MASKHKKLEHPAAPRPPAVESMIPLGTIPLPNNDDLELEMDISLDDVPLNPDTDMTNHEPELFPSTRDEVEMTDASGPIAVAGL